MKVLILYRPNSEYARQVEEYVRDFERRYGDRKLEVVSLDTREGAHLARLYDVVQYPAILSLGDDGQLLRAWEGAQLPLMDEVAGYSEPAELRLCEL